MKKSPTILFCGGGSFGHLIPSLAVAAVVKKVHPALNTVFVCADRREERERLQEKGQHFHALRAPKFPRMLSLSVLTFPLLFLAACIQARKILMLEQPDLVFSKGGYVSVPVCLMAAIKKIPIVLHESDSVPSLSTRLLARFATIICTGFPIIGLPPKFLSLTRHTGNPVRSEILSASEAAGQRITGFSGRRPVVMIIGGSQGSVALNDAVVSSLTMLLEHADIIHITGVGKMTNARHARYFVRETVSDELFHLYALSDTVVSRGGVGVLCELAMLKKAVVAVPLTGVGHDHQLRNAEVLAKQNALVLLPQEKLPDLPREVLRLLADPNLRKTLGEVLHHSFPPNAAETIAAILLAELQSSRLES